MKLHKYRVFSNEFLLSFLFQVGSFNYDATKMVFLSEFVPNEKEAIKSILDYQISISALRPEQTHYMALGEDKHFPNVELKMLFLVQLEFPFRLRLLKVRLSINFEKMFEHFD